MRQRLRAAGFPRPGRIRRGLDRSLQSGWNGLRRRGNSASTPACGRDFFPTGRRRRGLRGSFFAVRFFRRLRRLAFRLGQRLAQRQEFPARGLGVLVARPGRAGFSPGGAQFKLEARDGSRRTRCRLGFAFGFHNSAAGTSRRSAFLSKARNSATTKGDSLRAAEDHFAATRRELLFAASL